MVHQAQETTQVQPNYFILIFSCVSVTSSNFPQREPQVMWNCSFFSLNHPHIHLCAVNNRKNQKNPIISTKFL